MNCPVCQAAGCRRSRRRSLVEYGWSLLGVFPWRCRFCETRFYARAVPVRRLFYAHCGICGNADLRPISPERIPGVPSGVLKVLGLLPLRCEPCRHNFFSLRRPLPREALDQELSEEETVAK